MNSDEQLADWITTREAAAVAGCTYDGIMKRLARGKLEAVRFGGVWMIRRSSVAPKANGRTAEGRTSTARD